MQRLLILSTALLVGLAACQLPASDPGERGAAAGAATFSNAPLPDADPRFLLTARGDYVLSDSPPAIEVRFGSKVVRRAAWQD